jgi:hypothetical protein
MADKGDSELQRKSRDLNLYTFSFKATYLQKQFKLLGDKQ